MLQGEALTKEALNFPGLRHSNLDGTVLATIINARIHDLNGLKDIPPRPQRFKHVSLAAALSVPGRHFIMECKKSSPSLGDFCQDFDLDRLIACYAERASAISVLTEPHFFKGSPDYLSYVKARVSLPVIWKDFVIDEIQLQAAWNAGADAVLLMQSVLTQERFLDLYQKAYALGLEVLTEVSDQEEAQFALKHHCQIVGINNRDLRSLKIDLNRARTLAPVFAGSKTLVVSESGIKKHADIEALKPIQSFLIGSSLCIDPKVQISANTLLYGCNKVCGLKTEEGLEAVIQAHASIAGFIMVTNSPRYLDPEHAAKLMAQAQGRIHTALVFRDQSLNEVITLAQRLKPDFIQLHGHESLQYAKDLLQALPAVKLIKAFTVQDAHSLNQAEDFAKICSYLILDSKAPGSGQSFDWNLIPKSLNRQQILLSGGIGLNNLQSALDQGCAGLDLNSKLESAPGIKDPKLVAQAFALINAY